MLIENLFNRLLEDKEFFPKVFPYLKEDYFTEDVHVHIFKKMHDFNHKFAKQPTAADIKIMIEGDNSITEDDSDGSYKFLSEVKDIEEKPDSRLVFKEAEQWCQDRALEIALMDSVPLLKQREGRGQIQDKIREALAVSFEVKLGHDYFGDAPERYDRYTEQEDYTPLDIEDLNLMYGGGLVKKAMYMWMGRPNVGKTLIMCHQAAALMKAGYKVVYFTAEMAENRIAERIDANILDINIKELQEVDKKVFAGRLRKVYEQTAGRLYVKEFPTATANVLHLKAYLEELRLKKGFVPDFVFVDYLNIFTSSRIPAAKSMESYGYIKAVTEEMRGLAVELDIGLITATQTNRGGAKAGVDTMDYTDTGESFGVPMTVDWQGGIIQTPELFEQNKYIFKVLKSRFDENLNKCYTVGVDRSRMKLHKLAESEKEIPKVIKDRLEYEKQQENTHPFDFG
jgi:replicative DNA helicase